MYKTLSTLLLTLFIAALPAHGGNPDDRLKVYSVDMVDVEPSFPGGDRALLDFIREKRDRDNKGHGRVICGFVVMPDGEITCVSVLRGVDETLDREAVRIVSSMPHWEAGRLSDAAVPVYCVLPVTFR